MRRHFARLSFELACARSRAGLAACRARGKDKKDTRPDGRAGARVAGGVQLFAERRRNKWNVNVLNVVVCFNFPPSLWRGLQAGSERAASQPASQPVSSQAGRAGKMQTSDMEFSFILQPKVRPVSRSFVRSFVRSLARSLGSAFLAVPRPAEQNQG